MIALPDGAFRRLSSIALSEAGLNLQDGKRSFVAARLQRRLRATGASDFAAYLRLVECEGEPGRKERRHFVSALTTNVTGIFREGHHFAILAEFLESIPDPRPIRIWSAGCATGEETLSIAATSRAVLGPGWVSRCRILATDIDDAALRTAIQFPNDDRIAAQLLDGLPVALRGHVDAPGPAIPELMRGIAYMRHNLLEPLPSASPFDVIFCRNVTIYFAAPVQAAVQRLLLDRLAPAGLLCLGHSERLQVREDGIRLVGPTSYARVAAETAGEATWR